MARLINDVQDERTKICYNKTKCSSSVYAMMGRLFMNRQDVLHALQQQPEVDVLVIGGGVNGIGTYRDLALQGLNVLLVEKGDFCSGASAASSHMLHGGIRYLENGEFRLVREALHERNLLLKNAPHYAKPLPTTIPIFRWFSGLFNAPFKFLRLTEKPAERGAVVIKAGLIMYDLFTGPQQSMPMHDFKLRPQSLRDFPLMNKDIVCTATYYDAWMPYPERICLELLLDAEAGSDKAHAVNYVRASGGDGERVKLTDELSGETYWVKPRVVINAAGPWIDFVNEAVDEPTRFIGGTKGSHIIVDHPELFAATRGNEIFFENNDGRIVLIFPYLGRVMIGTTDIRIDDPEEAVCTQEEVDYMLNLVKRVFPTISISPEQIVFRFSGVRPLPSSESSSTGTISRDHSIRTSAAGEDGTSFPIHSLIGGKWTTFRAFSEQAANVSLKDLNASRSASTANLPIGGGRNYPLGDAAQQAWLDALQKQTELDRDVLLRLFERYGTYAAAVAQFMSAENDAPLQHLPEYTRREVLFIAQNEFVVHVDDFLLRRSLIAMLGYLSPELLRELTDIIGESLGWDSARIAEELSRTEKLMRQRHGLFAEASAV